MSEEDHKRDEKVLKTALNNLIEYFDTVQIFVTRHEPTEEDGTLEYSLGAGNYYARLGQIKVWQDTQANGAFFWDEDNEDDCDDDRGF